MSIKALLTALVAYGLAATLLFGGPFRAVGLLVFRNDRLGLPNWGALLALAALLSLGAVWLAARAGVPHVLLPAGFIVVAMGLAALMVGGYATLARDRAVSVFAPDIEIRSSIFQSFRNAPREFQFFLHGAALKGCVPFGWSYRQMAFYELPPEAAVNVLPPDWIARCGIEPRR